MIGRLKRDALALTAALFMVPASTSTAEAQETSGRFRVLIPDLFALEGANRNYGEDLAKELREAINQLQTHAPVERDEIRDNLRRFDLKMEELDCLRTRQLGAQMNVQVALCASYSEQGDQRVLQDVKFIDLGSSQEFAVEGFTTHRNDREAAAQRIVDAFGEYVLQLRHRRFCYEYAASSDWEGALRNCDDALALNPGDAGVMYQRAYILYETDRQEQALEQLEALLEVEPYHDEGLQLAGFIATSMGDAQRGRRYYGTYLELNPGAVVVRRNIAYEMFDAGDPEGAMLLIEEGIEGEPTPELLGDLGNYAFEAARQAMPEGAQQAGDEAQQITPEIRELYRKAIDAYGRLYQIQADSMSVSQLRNVILGHMNLGELEEAESFAEQVLQTHSEEAALWSVYSTVLERQERVDEAVDALERVAEIDPDYSNLYVRQANLLMQAGRREEAVPIFRQAVERGQDSNAVARMIFADAHTRGVTPKNYQYALDGIRAAKEFEAAAETRSMLDFWHGFVLLQLGIAAEEPQTVESARRALPMFRQARELFQAGEAYASREPSITLTQFLEAADIYIERQDAIIRRGG